MKKIILTLFVALLLPITSVLAVSNLTIDDASFDENTNILEVSGTTDFDEVMVSVFDGDDLLTFKTTSKENGKYHETFNISFAEDKTVIIKVGDINSTDYEIKNLDVKKSVEPLPSNKLTDDNGNYLMIVDSLKKFALGDRLDLQIIDDLDSLTGEDANVANFLKKQLKESQKLAAFANIRVINAEGDDVVLEKTDNGYKLFIKMPKEAAQQYTNFYLAGVDEEFNILEGHEFIYDEELGGLVGYIDNIGVFVFYEDFDVLYDFLDNTANQTYNLNNGDTLTLRINAKYSKFKGISVDKVALDKNLFTSKEGSTVITLSKDYMQSLNTGKHDVQVDFTDGKAVTTINVINTKEGTMPNTVDDILKYVLIGAIGFVGVVGCFIYYKKTKKN